MKGRSHTHHRGVAGGRWKKRAQKTLRAFRPNLQNVSIELNGEVTRVKLCAKCMKRIKKDMQEGKQPFYKLANPPANLVH
ncbi:mitochondrial large ribosomal subunit protein bL28m [Candidatus Woesebacteria bacterium]|nr:mitochondrial large ribosomal subunit protein bL28m [Candidatus Woesebacteria bacterium]